MIIYTSVIFVLSQLSDNDNKCDITEKTDQNLPFVLQLSIVSKHLTLAGTRQNHKTKPCTIPEWQLTLCVPLQSGQR